MPPIVSLKFIFMDEINSDIFPLYYVIILFLKFSADNRKRAQREGKVRDFSIFSKPDEREGLNFPKMSPQLALATYQYLQTCNYHTGKYELVLDHSTRATNKLHHCVNITILDRGLNPPPSNTHSCLMKSNCKANYVFGKKLYYLPIIMMNLYYHIHWNEFALSCLELS